MLELDNIPKGPFQRFRVPSDTLNIKDRVKVEISLHVKTSVAIPTVMPGTQAPAEESGTKSLPDAPL